MKSIQDICSVMNLSNFSPEERRRYDAFIETCPTCISNVSQMWGLLDLVWDEIGCDDKYYDVEKMARFYSHPVWLLNGCFVESDDISMGHRRDVANWVLARRSEIKHVLDYGGGFGTTVRLLAMSDSSLVIDFHEPYISAVVKSRMDSLENVRVVRGIESAYDCIICMDVLEHLQDPLQALWHLVEVTNLGKYIVFANNFMPIEKCHLRNTLHLYYTFRVFAYFMGLKRIEKCGANAIVYRRERFKQSLAWSWIRILEYCSRACYPLLRTLRGVYRLIVPLRSSSFVLQGECTPDAASDDGVTRDES